MELTSDVIIELTLNAIGYLAAGAFGVVVASILKRRNQAVPVRAMQDHEATRTTAPAPTESGRGQFVALGKGQNRGSQAPPEAKASEPRPRATRDRTEVLRMARQMLKAGAGPERIMQVLPVSETELGLLTYGSK